MVSYKKLYEEQVNVLNQEIRTGWICPFCEKGEIIQTGFEFVCENEDCKYDKTSGELFSAYAEMMDFKRKEDD